MRRLSILPILLGLLWFHLLGAVSDLERDALEGTEFWLGIMENRNTDPPKFIELTITSSRIAVYKIFIGDSSAPFYQGSIVAGTSSKVRIPWRMVEPRTSEKVEDKAIHITSDLPISVYALNYERLSIEATSVYPKRLLGDKYIVACYEPYMKIPYSRNSQFVVVATENSTMVSIKPSKKTSAGVKKDSVFQVMLDAGEIFQVQSLNTDNHVVNKKPPYTTDEGDLTGTLVEANRPIAVFSGSYSTGVIDEHGHTSSHLYEQLPPVNSWGYKHFAMPLVGKKKNTFRVLASTDNTTIDVESIRLKKIVNAGEFVEFNLDKGKASAIFSNKPSLLLQYCRSNDEDNTGDPFMMVIQSSEQMVAKASLNVYEIKDFSNYYLNILTKKNNKKNIMLDGVSQKKYFNDIPNSKYAYAQIEVEPGNHLVKSSNDHEGFAAYAYGYAFNEAYGYGAAYSLKPSLAILKYGKVQTDTILVQDDELVELEATGDYYSYLWSTGQEAQKIRTQKKGHIQVQAITQKGEKLTRSIYLNTPALIEQQKRLKDQEMSMANNANSMALNTAGAQSIIVEDALEGMQAPMKVGDVTVIYFKTGRRSLSPENVRILDEVARYIKESTTLRVQIDGHTDNIGSLQLNMNLSKKRAREVYNYLISRGVDPKIISANGYSYTKPKASNKTAAGRSKNRRVEITVVRTK